MIELILIEDNPGDARLIEEILGEADEQAFTLDHYRQLSDGLEAVERQRPDVLLLDLGLPDSSGLQTVERVRERVPQTPVVVLTGLDDQETGVRAVQRGAQDYLIKGDLHGRYLMGVIRYAIERKRIEEERERLIADLDAFAHTVAHDLKSPLQFVVGASELLQTHWDRVAPEEVREWLEQINRQSSRMGTIIDELLLLARVRADEAPLEPLAMREIVASALRRLAPLIEEYQAEVTVPDQWPVAQGYAPWVEQVWMNYLSNAVKYGGVPPRIRLGASIGEDKMVRFRLCNNGPSLSPEMRSRLFRPFSRLNQMEREGHGLGLSIVRRIVEKLGGDVGVEETDDGWTCFSFSLPPVAGEEIGSAETPSPSEPSNSEQ